MGYGRRIESPHQIRCSENGVAMNVQEVDVCVKIISIASYPFVADSGVPAVGEMVSVQITGSTPWSLEGELAGRAAVLAAVG